MKINHMSSLNVDRAFQYCGLSPESVLVGDDGSISGTLGSGLVNVKAWKMPPHVALANLNLNPQAIASFVRKYGVLEGTIKTVVESAHGASPLSFTVNTNFVREAQSILRLAWRGDRSALLQVEDVLKQINLQVAPSLVRREEIVLKTSDLWKYLCFAFSIDYIDGKTKTCTNPDCEHPYFVQKRKDQQFCSHRCAVLINVQRYRERQSETQ
jgi:hypothetical protein